MTEGGERGGCRIAPNKKPVVLFGKEYLSIREACADNNITYAQYIIMITENLHFENGEDLKHFIWKRRANRIAKGQKGNKNKLGWKSNQETYMRQSVGIRKGLAAKKQAGLG